MATLWEHSHEEAEGRDTGGLRINPVSAARMTQYLVARNRWMELRLCDADEEAIRAAEVVMRACEEAAIRGAGTDHTDE